MKQQKINVFWFRRDLRSDDNIGLNKALLSGLPVLAVFIFDNEILDKLDTKKDKRLIFIYDKLQQLKQEFEKNGSSLLITHGKVTDVFTQLLSEYNINGIYCNHDYEPYALERDQKIQKLFAFKDIAFNSYKDQLIFERDEILKNDGTPYTVFTPYSRQWKHKMAKNDTSEHPSEKLLSALMKTAPFESPALSDFGFFYEKTDFPPATLSDTILQNYHLTRNTPGIEGTTRLGLHLRFGTISIRKLVKKALNTNEVFLNELIWREFFMQILWHYPYVVTRSFKSKYDNIAWQNDEKNFDAWCRGETGYPMVDAAMIELKETGFMHNRLRMITASFLCKHLLIDWRWGEAYFASLLLDYELSSNNGNWQWAAGSGCDAAPYFRIFNPLTQLKKFDPKLDYVNKWISNYNSKSYPKPIVEHDIARKRALEVYKKSLDKVKLINN